MQKTMLMIVLATVLLCIGAFLVMRPAKVPVVPARPFTPHAVTNGESNLLYADRLAVTCEQTVRSLAGDAGTLSLQELAVWSSKRLTVTLDFYAPNDRHANDAVYFGPGSERTNRWKWGDILLVDPLSGWDHPNGGRSRFHVRAKVTGPHALLANDISLPVRIYRSFMNEVDDGNKEFLNAYGQIFGNAPTNGAGVVLEPMGEVVELKRIRGIDGPASYFASGIIDLKDSTTLNPSRGRQPASFAAFDADAYHTQYSKVQGDEEPDAWAFSRALTAAGFVSAGLAHPWSDKINSSRGTYQFALALTDKEVLDIPAPADTESIDDETKAKLSTLPYELKDGHLKDRLKNIGASRVLGRPLSNGSFIISTGVQKLVVNARARRTDDDVRWRMPGLQRLVEGSMDQCLVRAPAQVFMFSGHGWANSAGVELLNCYSFDNSSVYWQRKYFLVDIVEELPEGGWPAMGSSALPENRVILAEKWKKEEMRLQWAFLLGCYVLKNDNDPFSMQSVSGKFGRLVIRDLGGKGIIGFSEHGFTSASIMRRYVELAGEKGIAYSWMSLWGEDEMKDYSWFEQNERHGWSVRKNYYDTVITVHPAYLVRSDNARESLTPEGLKNPNGGNRLTYGELINLQKRVSFGALTE